MKRIFKIIGVLFFLIGLLGCTSAGGESPAGPLHYLALGDSYTIGEAVYAPNRWPTVLAGMLESEIGAPFVVEYRARTGWTTGNLLASLEATPPERDGYDLVSLLIGVNNQFRGYPFATYRSEVPQLIDLAVEYAGGNPDRVFVVSIPDYAYTTYGSYQRADDRQRISREIDEYNAWMEEYCASRGIAFFGITDITRRGIDEPELVASDGLHPSSEAYRQFADRIFAGFNTDRIR
jgi:acyl-CoA thioesterase-1